VWDEEARLRVVVKLGYQIASGTVSDGLNTGDIYENDTCTKAAVSTAS
jgi:hypothetical protein